MRDCKCSVGVTCWISADCCSWNVSTAGKKWLFPLKEELWSRWALENSWDGLLQTIKNGSLNGCYCLLLNFWGWYSSCHPYTPGRFCCLEAFSQSWSGEEQSGSRRVWRMLQWEWNHFFDFTCLQCLASVQLSCLMQLQLTASALRERTLLAAAVAETEQPSLPHDLPRSSLQAEGGHLSRHSSLCRSGFTAAQPCMRKEKITKVGQGCMKVQ